MQIDQIIRSSRKTIALIVQRDGKLLVRAPYSATNAQIMHFVNEKTDWIQKKQAQVQQRQAAAPVALQFVEGESFLYLGKLYPLHLNDQELPLLVLLNGQFNLAKSAQSHAKDIFIAWYKQQAHQVISERVTLFASQYNLTSWKQIRITSARTRWGSCSSSGTLSFTWRLVMAPLPALDYVVIHELAHLLEKNHSKRFWERVAAMLPDFAVQSRWLKENGQRLKLD